MKRTLTTFCLIITLAGCRFGNSSSSNNSAPDDPDKISGYYDTAPQSLKFCATATGNTICQSTTTNLIPSMISAEMTSPTALIVQDLDTGDAVFTAPQGGKTALPVWIQTDKTLYYANSTQDTPLWKDSTCTSKLYLEEEGAIVAGPANAVAGSKLKTSGRIQLRVRVTQIFEEVRAGACGQSLQAMSSCYQDPIQCGGADSGTNLQLQAQVQAIFNSYIQAHAMNAGDIPHLSNISYEVQYL